MFTKSETLVNDRLYLLIILDDQPHSPDKLKMTARIGHFELVGKIVYKHFNSQFYCKHYNVF